jgi:hypothetical protein
MTGSVDQLRSDRWMQTSDAWNECEIHKYTLSSSASTFTYVSTLDPNNRARAYFNGNFDFNFNTAGLTLDSSQTLYIYASLDDSGRFETVSNAITLTYTASSTCSGLSNAACNL